MIGLFIAFSLLMVMAWGLGFKAGVACSQKGDGVLRGGSMEEFQRRMEANNGKKSTLNATEPEVGGIPVGKPHSCDPSKRSYHGGSDVSTSPEEPK